LKRQIQGWGSYYDTYNSVCHGIQMQGEATEKKRLSYAEDGNQVKSLRKPGDAFDQVGTDE
jgi:hypothetical protein